MRGWELWLVFNVKMSLILLFSHLHGPEFISEASCIESWLHIFPFLQHQGTWERTRGIWDDLEENGMSDTHGGESFFSPLCDVLPLSKYSTLLWHKRFISLSSTRFVAVYVWTRNRLWTAEGTNEKIDQQQRLNIFIWCIKIKYMNWNENLKNKYIKK